MTTQIQKDLQNQHLQLGYDILGRLLSAAENYYCKCIGKSYNKDTAIYKNHDIFQNANKKSKETVRAEIINQINIFQASNQYYKSKYYSTLIPECSKEIIEDLNNWKNEIKNQKDIELYNIIISILKNKKVDIDSLIDENIEEPKTIKSPEQWAIMGTNASASTHNRIENINNNKNFVANFDRGNLNNLTPNPNFINFNEILSLRYEADNTISQLYNNIVEYTKNANVIKIIEQDYQNLRKLIKMINDRNSEYVFPESIIKKEVFLVYVQHIADNGKNPKNGNIFSKIIQLFSELA